MKLFITLFLLLASIFSQAQERPFNYTELNQKILNYVNVYRDSLEIHPLKDNIILNRAAEDQADYMNWNNTLSHDQVTYNKQTPAERVFFYNGNYNYIGENVAFVFAADTLPNKKVVFKDVDSVANEFFQSWINSLGHRKNISNPLYYQSGISFSFDSKTNKIFAAQVFSAYGYDFPKNLQSPAKAYGVQSKNAESCGDAKNFHSSTTMFANNLIVKGDSIFLWHHNLKYFKSIIANPNDGYAVDIVFKEQLPCNSPNLFHGSGIFDGYMLPPVFQYELYKNNRSANPEKLMTFVGVLPKGISNYELNTILIRDNSVCDYSYPVDVPSKDIAPLYIQPLWLDAAAETHPLKIDTTIVLNFEFERSSTIWNESSAIDQIRSIYGYVNLVKKIEINTYSSVEGKEWFNIKLQEERAAKIENFVQIINKEGKLKINSKVEENWDEFYKQVEKLNLTEFDNKNKEEVKRFLKANRGNALYDSLLYQQRIANATIKIKGIIKPGTQGPERYLFWDEALRYNDPAWLTHLLYEESKITDGSRSYWFNLPDTSLYNDFTPLVNNMIAKKIINRNQFWDAPLNATDYLNLTTDNQVNAYTVANWINFYYKDLYYKSIRYFVTNPEENKPAEDPEKVMKVLINLDSAWFADTTLLPRLKLNHLIASIHYYTYTNRWERVNFYFDQIFDHFYAADLPVKEGLDLALFCNHYYRHAKAVKLLDYYYEKNTLDEEACFALAKTAILIQSTIEEERYLGYMKLAIKMNQPRWCTWLETNFQVKRNEKVKGLYCETCL